MHAYPAMCGKWRVERFDLVILDLNLPEKDGLALLRFLRARKNPVPTLILTARARPDERVTGLDLGADDDMVKFSDLRVRPILRRRVTTTAGEVLDLPCENSGCWHCYSCTPDGWWARIAVCNR